jgi:hypothetical protein
MAGEDGNEVLHAAQWGANEGGFDYTLWELAANRAPFSGDTTVPLESLTAARNGTTIFRRLPHHKTMASKTNPPGRFDGPNHVDAPQSIWLWDKVIDVIQDTTIEDECDQFKGRKIKHGP